MLKKIKQLLGSNPGDKPVTVVADRFKQVFNDHGIQTNQIPSLFTEIKFADLLSNETLLEALSPELRARVAQFFGVRIEWLEGVDDRIYDNFGCYKDFNTIVDKISSVLRNIDQNQLAPVRALTTSNRLDRNSGSLQELAPVVLQKIAQLDGHAIYRYYIFQDGYNWQHPPARIELKAIVHLLFSSLNSPIPLLEISQVDMNKVLEGEIIPYRLLKRSVCTNPSLEDYILTPDQSPLAKETDELPEVLAYIENHGLQNFCFSPPERASASQALPDVLAAPSVKKKKAGAGQINDERWEAVRNVARGIRVESPHLSKSEIIRRLINEEHSLGITLPSHLEDTIYRNIKDLDQKKQSKG